MTVKNISWSNLHEMLPTRRGSNPQSSDQQSDAHPTEPPRPAYSWAMPAILAAGKGRGVFIFLLFLHFHSFSFSPSFYFTSSTISSPFLWETAQNDPQWLTCRLTQTQSINKGNRYTFRRQLCQNYFGPSKKRSALKGNICTVKQSRRLQITVYSFTKACVVSTYEY